MGGGESAAARREPGAGGTGFRCRSGVLERACGPCPHRAHATIATRTSAPDGYIAIVRIERNDEVSADRHPPRFGERWTSAAETQRDVLEYAVKLIDRDMPGAAEARGTHAARGAGRHARNGLKLNRRMP
nr:DUF6566 family protein [Burkholderia sp. BCC1988]